jgi:hypothetical protein
MLGHDPYYHEILKRTVVAFGSMFNDIFLIRKNKDGVIKQKMKIPLSYGPKMKFLARLKADPNLAKSSAISLPRIGFELGSFSYDASRKLNKINTVKVPKIGDSAGVSKQFSPVPYSLSFELSIMVKNSDDGIQILEQILPTFSPSYTMTIKDSSELKNVQDIPVTLESVSYEDSYDGDFTSRRAIIYTLSFTANVQLYGPVTSQGIIKKVDTSMYADVPVNSPARKQTYTVTPDPSTATENDDFGFDESWGSWENVD